MANSDRAVSDSGSSARDAEVWREIARRYAPMVYATCRRILRDPSQAEQAAQESFEALVRATHESDTHLGAWLHRAATQHAQDRLRREGRRREPAARPSGSRGDTAEPSWEDLEEHIDSVVSELPDACRVPVVAHYLEGQTHSEIARSLGLSPPTVTSRIDKGVNLIRKALDRRGIAIGASSLAALMATHLSEAVAVPASLTAAISRLEPGALPSVGAIPAARRRSPRLLTRVALPVLIVAGIAAALLMRSEPTEDAPVETAAKPEPAASSVADAPPRPAEVAPRAAETTAPAVAPVATPVIEGTVRAEQPVRRAVTDFEIGYWTGNTPVPQPLPTDRLLDWHRVNDAAGRFLVELSPEHARTPVSLVVRAPGYAPAWLANVSPKSTPVAITVHPAVTVKGRVVDSAGQPVPEAEVKALDATRRPLDEALTVAGADGSFELVLAPRAWEFRAAREGYSEARTLLPLEALPAAEVTLTLLRPGAVEGMVLVDHRPQADADVNLQSVTNGVRLVHARSGRDGSFRFDDLAPGEYIFVSTANRRELAKRVWVQEGQVTRSDADYRSDASLEGVVRAGGAAEPGAVVRAVVRSLSGDVFFETRADVAGQYRLDEIPSGAVVLRVGVPSAPPGHIAHAVRTLDVRPGEAAHLDVDLDVDPGSLACRFIPDPVKLPGGLAGPTLMFGPHTFSGSLEEALFEAEAFGVGEGEVDRDGVFRVDGLEPGQYTVLYCAPPRWFSQEILEDAALPLRPQALTVTVHPDQETIAQFVVEPADDL